MIFLLLLVVASGVRRRRRRRARKNKTLETHASVPLTSQLVSQQNHRLIAHLRPARAVSLPRFPGVQSLFRRRRLLSLSLSFLFDDADADDEDESEKGPPRKGIK